MDNKPALYVHPELALEMLKELKTAADEIEPLFEGEEVNQFLDTFTPLTSRDLIFYAIGKVAATKMAEDALRSLRTEKGKQP